MLSASLNKTFHLFFTDADSLSELFIQKCEIVVDADYRRYSCLALNHRLAEMHLVPVLYSAANIVLVSIWNLNIIKSEM